MRRSQSKIRLLLVAVPLAFALTGALVGYVAAEADPLPPASVGSERLTQQTVEDCGACHPQSVEAFTGSLHAAAFEAGEFDLTCEGCHGEIPEGHPEEAVDAGLAQESCQGCHAQTQAEFTASPHEETGLDCMSCHYAHNNGLRLEDATAQCLNCHGQQLEGVLHTTHVETGQSCRTCHGWIPPDQLELMTTEKPYTGHDFVVGLDSCVDCHAEEGQAAETTVEELPEETVLAGQAAITRVEQLENAIERVAEQQENQTRLSVVGGAVAGLLLGGLGTWAALRFRNATHIMNDEDENPEGGDDHEA
ncbi:MAG: hypothetical protein GYB68_11455 [Chloroflexi bacterium]|nr:hypothetical protein [Chloroflexota bacterium]